MSAPTSTVTGGHWWSIKLGELGEVASDELTLDEVERLEKITDTPWALLNPLASLRQAKGWLLVAAMHLGKSVDEAEAHLASLNLGAIKGAFQLHADAERSRRLELVATEGVEPTPPSSASTSEIG